MDAIVLFEVIAINEHLPTNLTRAFLILQVVDVNMSHQVVLSLVFLVAIKLSAAVDLKNEFFNTHL